MILEPTGMRSTTRMTGILSFLIHLPLCLLLFLNVGITSASSVINIPLNYPDCERNYTYEVETSKVYHVMVMPDFEMNCPGKYVVKFRSARQGGRLCLIQDGKINHIYDNNAQLKAYDGSERGNKIFGIEYHPQEWRAREYCSVTQEITIELEKKVESASVDISKLDISLKVIDIESKARHQYLDERYCDNTVPLMNSRLSIFNLPPANAGFPSRTLKSICAIYVERQIQNRSICLVYNPLEPLYQVGCDSNWTFQASDLIFQKDKGIIYQIGCSDKRAKEMHTWCANNDTEGLTLIFSRKARMSSDSALEPPNMFSFLVTDHYGSADSLLEILRKGTDQKDLPNDDGLSAAAIAGIVVAVLVAVTLLAFIVVKWKRSYQAVLTDET